MFDGNRENNIDKQELFEELEDLLPDIRPDEVTSDITSDTGTQEMTSLDRDNPTPTTEGYVEKSTIITKQSLRNKNWF